MKLIRSHFSPIIILLAIVTMQACKAKKLAQKPAPPEAAATPVPPPAPAPQPVSQPEPGAAPVAAPNYNFSNIQFEFNSGILKTDSYPILDKAVAEMKKDTTVKFILKGYASAEGTDEHNMALSVDRANAVKAYFMNSGISGSNISTKGFGESNPVADNTTEDGRVLNRRVEIRKLN